MQYSGVSYLSSIEALTYKPKEFKKFKQQPLQWQWWSSPRRNCKRRRSDYFLSFTMENIDVNYAPHLNTRHQVLSKYSSALKQLRLFAGKTYDLRPFAFDNYVLFQYFQHRVNGDSTSSDTAVGIMNFSPMNYFKIELLNHILDHRRQILYWIFYFLLALLCFFVYRHEQSATVAERSVHSIVYPGMRMWRRLTLPLIERFPRLTELYDESCLMGNPFFQVDDLSCSPCHHADGVVDVTDTLGNGQKGNVDDGGGAEREKGQEKSYKRVEETVTTAEAAPVIFKINQDPIQLEDFHYVFSSNHETFQRDAYRVQSTNRDITNLDDMFSLFNQTTKIQAHNLWRCNRMMPARLLRQLIARPTTLPNSFALERYMAIDTPAALSYTLPDTECPYVYVQQALGARFIILRPTSQCRHRCRTLSVRLPQSHVLSYNWWYWKPISAPDPVSDSMSISLIGSYC